MFVTLDKKDCKFGYRSSIFKEKQGRYCIVDVTLALSSIPKPIITYKPISEHFSQL
jgi:UDP-N-acetylenolpyruvoylglucosamine reductase